MDYRSQDGYLIIEVIVAVAIIAIALVSHSAAQVQSHRLNANAAVTTEIRSAADQVAEQLRLHQADVSLLPQPITADQEADAPAGQPLHKALTTIIRRPPLRHIRASVEATCMQGPGLQCQFCISWQSETSSDRRLTECSPVLRP